MCSRKTSHAQKFVLASVFQLVLESQSSPLRLCPLFLHFSYPFLFFHAHTFTPPSICPRESPLSGQLDLMGPTPRQPPPPPNILRASACVAYSLLVRSELPPVVSKRRCTLAYVLPCKDGVMKNLFIRIELFLLNCPLFTLFHWFFRRNSGKNPWKSHFLAVLLLPPASFINVST